MKTFGRKLAWRRSSKNHVLNLCSEIIHFFTLHYSPTVLSIRIFHKMCYWYLYFSKKLTNYTTLKYQIFNQPYKNNIHSEQQDSLTTSVSLTIQSNYIWKSMFCCWFWYIYRFLTKAPQTIKKIYQTQSLSCLTSMLTF